ncbi:MAG: prolipoprotein diacylglyceryl transferase [Patescibacteria group bacterium]|nr:prolipoprotein diacylglyceryl transferase [Patescibacteria group bacterium]
MIPYFSWTTIQIGPLTVYVWGIFVALGFIFAAWVAARRAKQLGLEPRVIYDLTFWMIIAGFVGGRLGYVLFYDPETFIYDPVQIFQVWDGGSSVFGGFILATLVGIWFLKKKKVNVLAYADTAVFGLPFGLWIGRLGCFLIHDHPGTVTKFFLGVYYPDGVIRHDHGLYLSLTGLFIALVFLWISRKDRIAGTYIALFTVLYGFVRFFLDFTRVADVRYLGLTPAQYFSIIMFGLGIYLFYKIRKSNN